MVGMDLEARYSSGTRSFRLVLLSFPPFSSGQTWPIIRRESSKLSFSTLSERTRGTKDRKIKFKTKFQIKTMLTSSIFGPEIINNKSINLLIHCVNQNKAGAVKTTSVSV